MSTFQKTWSWKTTDFMRFWDLPEFNFLFKYFIDYAKNHTCCKNFLVYLKKVYMWIFMISLSNSQLGEILDFTPLVQIPHFTNKGTEVLGI